MKDFQLCIRLFSLQVTPPHSQGSLSHARVHAHTYTRAYSRVEWSMRDVGSTQYACNKRACDQKCCGLRLSRDGGGRGGGKRRTDVDPIHATLSGDHILANCDTELRPNDNKSTGQADVFASRSRTRRLAIVCPVHDA